MGAATRTKVDARMVSMGRRERKTTPRVVNVDWHSPCVRECNGCCSAPASCRRRAGRWWDAGGGFVAVLSSPAPCESSSSSPSPPPALRGESRDAWREGAPPASAPAAAPGSTACSVGACHRPANQLPLLSLWRCSSPPSSSPSCGGRGGEGGGEGGGDASGREARRDGAGGGGEPPVGLGRGAKTSVIGRCACRILASSASFPSPRTSSMMGAPRIQSGPLGGGRPIDRGDNRESVSLAARTPAE